MGERVAIGKAHFWLRCPGGMQTKIIFLLCSVIQLSLFAPNSPAQSGLPTIGRRLAADWPWSLCDVVNWG